MAEEKGNNGRDFEIEVVGSTDGGVTTLECIESSHGCTAPRPLHAV